MKRIILMLTVLTLLLCSCASQTQNTANDNQTPVTVNMPTGTDVNGYRLYPKAQSSKNKSEESSTVKKVKDYQSSKPDNSTSYYANTNTKKFHLSSCASAKRIKNENLYITSDRSELISSGYVPCKQCSP